MAWVRSIVLSSSSCTLVMRVLERPGRKLACTRYAAGPSREINARRLDLCFQHVRGCVHLAASDHGLDRLPGQNSIPGYVVMLLREQRAINIFQLLPPLSEFNSSA